VRKVSKVLGLEFPSQRKKCVIKIALISQNTQEDFLGSENETEDGNPSSLWFKYFQSFQFYCTQICRFLKQKEKIHLWIYYFRLSFAFLQDVGLFSQIRNFTILQIPRSHLRKYKCSGEIEFYFDNTEKIMY